MCDYSLHAVATRDAVKGDVLAVNQFNYMTRGMRDAAKSKPLVEHACAVCLKEGTELSLTAPVVEEYGWPSFLPLFARKRAHKHATATFRKFMPKEAHKVDYVHKDGLEFPDGTRVLLNNLALDQVMTVLQVPHNFTDKEISGLSVREREMRHNIVRTREDWMHLYASESAE